MHICVDRGGVAAIADVRVDAVLMVGAGIVAVADYRPVRPSAITQASRAYCRLISIAGTVHPDVHGLIRVHRRGEPGIDEYIGMSGRNAASYGYAIAIAYAIEHVYGDVVGGVMPGIAGMKQRERPAIIRLVAGLGRRVAVRNAGISVGADAPTGYSRVA